MTTKNGMMLAGMLSTVMLTGCLVTSRHHGEEVYMAPPLPAIVVLETEPYYVQGGYHYHYRDNGWYYSRSRSGPWNSLPRDRYPRETRYQRGNSGRDGGRNSGHKGR